MRVPVGRRTVPALLVTTLVMIGCSSVPAQVPPPDPATSTTTAQPDPSKCGATAAAQLNWGNPQRESHFTAGLDRDWHPYGPEPGHNGAGIRDPKQVSVAAGVATLTSTADGTTAAMSWHPGQRYGRWEACLKSDAAKGGLNAVMLLWPNAEDFPVGGEVDFMEIMSADRQTTSFFLHYGADNQQIFGETKHDATQWTAWALEWTPQHMIAYVNGRKWYETTEVDKFPPRPMHLCIQLDYFGGAPQGTAMHVDWARQWALPDSEPSTLSLAPGDPATGQPKDYPGRNPRAG